MRIEIELPDWANERHIRIFAGFEEVAKKIYGEPWQIKAGRCRKCGKCCMGSQPRTFAGFNPDDEGCKYLIRHGREYECSQGANRPFNCCSTDQEGEEHCSVTWENID